MQVSAAVTKSAGVEAALIAMGSELNLGLLDGLGFPGPRGAGPNDLVVAIRAGDATSLAGALAVLADALTARPPASADPSWRQNPRTVSAAARAAGPGLALISVPGQHAFTEAMDALEAGCDVMIFSDNVPVEQEVILKDRAAGAGLLVMGPDCGTAVVGGIGLGFSHTLARGPVGLVAASGTGAQQILCLLDAADTGVSAVLGVGGRDLSAAVGGRSARGALDALDDDPATELILVVSKPPAPAVAAGLRAYSERLATPVRFAFTGLGEPDLTAATEEVLRALGKPAPRWPRWTGPGRRSCPGALRGLFAGGTLCDEAMVIASERLGPIRSNIPLRPEWRLSSEVLVGSGGPGGLTGSEGSEGSGGSGWRIGPEWPASSGRPEGLKDSEGLSGPDGGHTMIDFGDDELTAGRPHPMIDQSLRIERFAAEARDPAAGVILLDVVLGHGAHPDPAGQLAPAIATAGDVPVVVSLIGARSDPQGRDGQASALREAGAQVFASNAQAARFACDLIGSGS